MAEWAVRGVLPQPTFSTIRESPGYYRASWRYPLTLSPGVTAVQQGPDGEFEVAYSINDAGQRGPLHPRGKGSGVFRILCLGDSFTFGQGVNDAETWPACLQGLSPPGVEVWNLGYCAGFSPDSYALFARTEMPSLSPDLVVVQLFSFNDIDDLRNNVWESPGPDGFPARIRSRLNYIDRDGRRLSAETYPLRLRLPVLRDSQAFQLAARVLTRTDGMGRPVSILDYTRRVHQSELAPDLEEPWERFRTSVTALDRAVSASGAKCLFVLVPDALQVEDRPEFRQAYLADPHGPFDPEEPNFRIRTFLAGQGIACLDLLEPFRRLGADALYYRLDGHLKPAGQEALARAVRRSLSERGWLPLESPP